MSLPHVTPTCTPIVFQVVALNTVANKIDQAVDKRTNRKKGIYKPKAKIFDSVRIFPL